MKKSFLLSNRMLLSFVMMTVLTFGIAGIAYSLDGTGAGTSLTPSLEDPAGNRTGDKENSVMTFDLVLAGEDGSFDPTTCDDGIDNGPDGFTDRTDPDCLPNGFTVETITLTGPVEIERYSSLGPDGAPGGGDDKIHTVLAGDVVDGSGIPCPGGPDGFLGNTDDGPGPDGLYGTIDDGLCDGVDDTGKHQIDTEIVSMSLTGTSTLLGTSLTVTEPLSEVVTGVDRNGDFDILDTNGSAGLITQQSPGIDFPADSFFDVYFDISAIGFGSGRALIEPNRVQADINPLTGQPFAPPGTSGITNIPPYYLPSVDNCGDGADNNGNGLKDEDCYKKVGDCVVIFIDLNLNGAYDPGFDIVLLLCGVKHTLKSPPKPTAITLESFHVTPEDVRMLIYWSTGSEIDTEGFNILRSSSPNGPFVRVNSAMIPAKAISPGGAFYSFVDNTIANSETYYYKLEDVDSRGKSARYGPVAAVVEETSEKEPAPTVSSGPDIQEKQTTEAHASSVEQEEGAGMPDSAAMPTDTSTYTIVAKAAGPAWFLSGEVVDVETVHGILPRDYPEAKEQKTEVRSQKTENMQDAKVQEQEVGIKYAASPTSIRFRIIDVDGNEVAMASLDAKSGDLALQKEWDGEKIILTWYATEPVNGFHILRSTKIDGTYSKITKTPVPYIGTGAKDKIFRFTYLDRNVQKGESYYYRLETLSKEESKTASSQK